MSNFFEQELRKLFGDGKIIDDPRFVGRTCMGSLGGDLRVRAEFVTMGYADHYEALRLTVLKRTDGEVDRICLSLRDVLGVKEIPGNSNFRKRQAPYIWTYQEESKWYAYQPTPADYQVLRRAAGDYLDVFRDRMPEREQNAPARKPPRRTPKSKGRGER